MFQAFFNDTQMPRAEQEQIMAKFFFAAFSGYHSWYYPSEEKHYLILD